MAKLAKSIRVAEDVYAYIERYKGEGFNQKFENIIRDAMQSEEKRKDRIKQLDRQITEQEKKLKASMEKAKKVENVSYQVTRILSVFQDINSTLEIKG